MSKTTTTSTSKKTTRRLVANKTATASTTTAAITEAQIAERAFTIYLAEGCPDGRHLDHWHQAVSELRG